jgi:D-serine deaminase-like pyridoxal phosphate-dependent protein
MKHADDVERVLDAYRDRIGLAVEELATPALVLDRAVLERNIAAMQQLLRGGAALRPHGKAHKSPEIAALQLRAGAIGIMTATVWEALALARAGIPDILIGNIVRGRVRCAAVAETAGYTRTTALVDDTGNADELAAAARQAGVEIDVLVDLDVGQHRTGARTPDEAVELARHVARTPGLRLRGVHGYEGHVSLEQDAERRRAGALEASDRRSACADAIRDDGGVVEIVSAGGTGMWDSTGRDPRVTELHPGSYVFMDAAHWSQVPEPEASLHVLATVLSRKDRTVILDTGRKTLGTVDPIPPMIRDLTGPVRLFHEEHLGVEADASPPPPGAIVEIVPSYAPAAVTLHEVYHLVEDGRVVDVWPVLARAGGREGAYYARARSNG